MMSFRIMYLVSGDSYTGQRRIVMTVTDQTETRVDLSAADLIFRIESASGDVLVTKSTPSGIEIATPQTGETKGVCYVELAEADTEGLAGRYVWELEASEGGEAITLGHGSAYVKGDIIINIAS